MIGDPEKIKATQAMQENELRQAIGDELYDALAKVEHYSDCRDCGYFYFQGASFCHRCGRHYEKPTKCQCLPPGHITQYPSAAGKCPACGKYRP